MQLAAVLREEEEASWQEAKLTLQAAERYVSPPVSSSQSASAAAAEQAGRSLRIPFRPTLADMLLLSRLHCHAYKERRPAEPQTSDDPPDLECELASSGRRVHARWPRAWSSESCPFPRCPLTQASFD